MRKNKKRISSSFLCGNNCWDDNEMFAEHYEMGSCFFLNEHFSFGGYVISVQTFKEAGRQAN